jgi:hypothetical protein
MTFRVITPLPIDDDVFVSSTIDEPDTGETAWDNTTSYSVGDVVYYTNHKVYESLINSNLDNEPDLEIQNDPDQPPTNWLELGYTNRWKMFDLLRNVKSESTSPVEVVLAPGVRINSIGLFGLEADSVTIQMHVGSGEIYSYTETSRTRFVENWTQYFFDEFEPRPSLARFDLPMVSTATITVTLESASTVKLGSLVIGNNLIIGEVQYGAESDELNFSRIERAFDGTSLLLPRRSIPKIITRVFAEKSQIPAIRLLRQKLNAVPAVWAGLDQEDDEYFEPLLVLGVYKRFSFNLDYPDQAVIDLEVEEI